MSVYVTVRCPSVGQSVRLFIDSQYAAAACSWLAIARARAADIGGYHCRRRPS